MAANRPVWGIDLGQVALKAIALRSAGDKVEVVDYAYIEHQRILSQPEVDRPALVAEAMKQFTDKHDVTHDAVVVAVPGQHTLARFVKLPAVEKKAKIPELVEWEAKQQIPFDMEEVIWDYQIFSPPTAPETNVGIFAMRRELLREHLFFASSLNIEPAAVQAAPLALYNALKYDGLLGEEAVAIVDIGAQNTDLLAFDGESLWTRNIPIGGNNFTEALLKTFKLSFNKAERLKREAQTHKYRRQIFQAMRPVFADLVAEVQRSIGFYTSSRRGVRLNKLIVMGNAFELPGLSKFIEQNLGMEVIRPTSFKRLAIGGITDAARLTDHMMSFGVAYGLALQGLGEAQITSSLLPPEIAKQVVWRKKTPWFYGAAACLALAAGAVWARNIMDQGALQAATGGPEAAAPMIGTEEEAEQIVLNGPPGQDLPPRVYAATILEAARRLTSAESEERSKNDAAIKQIQDIAALQTYKAIWPRILQVIHGALPTPDPEVLAAMSQGPAGFQARKEADPEKFDRANRKTIYIDQFSAQYSGDVMQAFLARKDGNRDTTGGAGMMPAGVTGGTALPPPSGPGFVITLTGRTPHKDAFNFLNSGFLENLRRDGEKMDKIKISPEGVYLLSCEKISRSRTGMGGGGSTFRMGDGGAVAAQALSAADKDPVTGESMLDDYQFEIIVAVLLPDAPAPSGGGGGAAGAMPASPSLPPSLRFPGGS